MGCRLGTFYGPYGWADLAWAVSQVAAAAGVAEPVAAPGRGRRRARRRLRRARRCRRRYEGFDGVACSDSINPTRREAWWDAGRARDQEAPYFGSAVDLGVGRLRHWPAESPRDRYLGPWTASTAAPVLVVGNTYDPATPYSGAQTVNGLLPGSRLLTVLGWGHTSLGYSTCADRPSPRYLVNGRLPAVGTRCAFDVTPFDDAVAPGGRRAVADERACGRSSRRGRSSRAAAGLPDPAGPLTRVSR